LYKNKNEMTVIVKRFRTHISLGNLGLSLGKVYCSQGKLAFPQKTIMSLGKRNLTYFGEQLKPFFPWGIIMSNPMLHLIHYA
jgi:hypothetical protein